MTATSSSDLPNSFLVDESLTIQAPIGQSKRHLTDRLNTLPNIYFSEIDQAFLVWGALTLVIFSLGQFSTLSWAMQAILDAALTGVSIATTSGLTWAIASIAKLRWVVLLWAGLMSLGTIATLYGIFYGSALILSNLCVLWLSLCAVGYGAMAIGMHSCCFTVACLVHLGAIAALSYTSSYQFFDSGLVMALTLFFFSVVPWDMHIPSENYG
ncbi:MAG: hypothetical protein WBD47_03500 [Phormidesmis sp.]